MNSYSLGAANGLDNSSNSPNSTNGNNITSSASSQPDIKQHFVTREGYYKNQPIYEYSRPQQSRLSGGGGQQSMQNNNNIGQGTQQQQQQQNLPVKISMLHVTDDETGCPERILFNVGREMFIYAFRSIWQVPDLSRPMDRQLHKVQISCHDVNVLNASVQGCSLLIGFINGSFEVYDQRTETHLYNEDRLLDKSRVTCVKWLPGSKQQFVVGFASGQLFQCDESLPWLAQPPSYQLHKSGEGYAVYTCKSRTARNPAYRWMIGDGGSLNAIAFSPCTKYLATVGHDGVLRVFQLDTNDLLDPWVTAVSFDTMTSCLAAPDTTQTPVSSGGGGPDRLFNGTSGSAGPPPALRITTYRFASVGQDCSLCLWELAEDVCKQAAYSRLRGGSLMVTSLPTVLAAVPAPVAAAKSVQASVKKGIGMIGGRSAGGAGNGSGAAPATKSGVPPSESRSGKIVLGSPLCPKLEEVPILEPLVCKRIAPERLNDIVFHEDCVLISTQDGIVMLWSRPGRLPITGTNNLLDSSRHNSCSN